MARSLERDRKIAASIGSAKTVHVRGTFVFDVHIEFAYVR